MRWTARLECASCVALAGVIAASGKTLTELLDELHEQRPLVKAGVAAFLGWAVYHLLYEDHYGLLPDRPCGPESACGASVVPKCPSKVAAP